MKVSSMSKVVLNLAGFVALGFLMLTAAACGERSADTATVTSEDPLPTPEPTRDVPVDWREIRPPVESLEIHVAESDPPQYFAEVVFELPQGCGETYEHEESRSGNTIVITATRLEAPYRQLHCTHLLSNHHFNFPLGTDFRSGETYTVHVNRATETFVAQ